MLISSTQFRGAIKGVQKQPQLPARRRVAISTGDGIFPLARYLRRERTPGLIACNGCYCALAHLRTVERSLAIVEATSKPEASVVTHWQRARARLAEIQVGLSRIEALVGKLRTFSRLDEGERKRVSIRESVESVLVIRQHRNREGLTVVTHFGEPDVIDCYPDLLNQAVMNLIGNALDAVNGPGTIAITTGASNASNGQFELALADTGCGMPQHVRDRAFEPFFTTKAVGAGTGLGLSITYSIAKKHGGDVELKPREGGGTRAAL